MIIVAQYVKQNWTDVIITLIVLIADRLSTGAMRVEQI